jgi:hypothetical protein
MRYQGRDFPTTIRQQGMVEPRCRPPHDRHRREGHLGWQLGHPPIHDGDDRFPRTPTITLHNTLWQSVRVERKGTGYILRTALKRDLVDVEPQLVV